MSASIDDKLEKRKLDALRRGIHRIGQEATLPFSVNLVGIGSVGNAVVAEVMKTTAAEGPPMSVLAVDVGEASLAAVTAAAAHLPAGRAHVQTMALPIPTRDELFGTLRRYREFLKLEYPRYYWNPNYEAWLPAATAMPAEGDYIPRAVSKALYGREYYEGARPAEVALRQFATTVDQSGAQTVICVVFGVGDGTGTGIAVDLARHLSNVAFGRRALVVGIGILPNDGDPAEHRNGAVFSTLNELDCMCDGAKNEGVIAVWGDLDRNPFTGGVILVPTQYVYEATGSAAATTKRVNAELAAFMTHKGGADLFETLRLLNWVGAPPTQHSAARTAYGPRWAHVFGFADLNGPIKADATLKAKMGLLDSYTPQFFEPRSLGAAGPATAALNEAFNPTLASEAVEGGTATSVQFVLPCITKGDLEIFYSSRDTYDQLTWNEKLLAHSWLLDLGVMLCEPAIRFEGMAGECLWGCACWVVVPYQDIRGAERKSIISPMAVPAKAAE
jgi:hypothetical protein